MSNKRLLEQTREKYLSLYEWHKQFGIQMLTASLGSDFVNSDFSKYYKETLEYLPEPTIATMTQMAGVALEVIKGSFAWSSSFQVNGTTIHKIAFELLKNKEEFKIDFLPTENQSIAYFCMY